MLQQTYKGKLVTFEGGDGSGKDTLIAGIRPIIEASGKEVLWLREPGGTSLGELVRSILLDPKSTDMTAETELLLMEASRAQLVRQKINPALEEGYLVLCNRFSDSSTAYQGFGRNLSPERVGELNQFATGGLVPDLTVLTKLPYEIALKRLAGREKSDRLDKEGREFHERAIEGFEYVARRHPERVAVIDATKSPEAMQEDTLRIFREREII